MEGMPRFPMLAPELKVPAQPLTHDNFSMKIKEYILIHYQDDPSKYEVALNEMISLRQHISRLIPDVETTCQMKRYYAQLLMMKSRFPMEENDQINIPFSWIDRAMDMPSAVVYEDVDFELACVLFDIGAIHAIIAASESRESEDSIKNAFMHFQQAAWPFQQLRDQLNPSRFALSLGSFEFRYASLDFDKDLLTFYVNVLLAQAQEALVEKSLIDHRNCVAIARLSVHLRDLYQDCRSHMETSTLSEVVSSSRYKEYARTCEAKSLFYGAIANLHMGMQADEDQKYGVRLGYYAAAFEQVKAAMKVVEKDKRDAMRQTAAFIYDVIRAKEENARKENDVIYHERIPSGAELMIGEGVSKVKPLAFDPMDISVGGEDLFAALLPVAVLKAVSVYEEEKATLKRKVLEQIAEKDKVLDEFIASLRLAQLNLDAAGADLQLPEMLLERHAAFTARPDAFPQLLDVLHKVGEKAMEAEAMLASLAARLNVINIPEVTRDQGYEALRKEVVRITDTHHQARTNNAELQKAMAAHSENLRLLALPLQEMARRVIRPAIRPSETKEGAQLKRMLEKVEEMRLQRTQLLLRLEDELKRDEIAKRLLGEKNTDNEGLFAKELKKHEATQKLIEANLNAQPRILDALTEANADFADLRAQLTEISQRRDQQALALVAAFDVYTDVSQKANEGLAFYEKLLGRSQKLSDAIAVIEEVFEGIKKRDAAKKAAEEERVRKARLESEVRDSLGEFSISASEENFVLPPSALSQSRTPLAPRDTRGSERPRLADYLSFYRTKAGAAAGPSPPAMPPTLQQHSGYSTPSPSPSPGLASAPHSSTVPAAYTMPTQQWQQPSVAYEQRVPANSYAPSTVSWQQQLPAQNIPNSQISPEPSVAPIPQQPTYSTQSPMGYNLPSGYALPPAPSQQHFPSIQSTTTYAPPPQAHLQQSSIPSTTWQQQQYQPPVAPPLSQQTYTSPPASAPLQPQIPQSQSYGPNALPSQVSTTPSVSGMAHQLLSQPVYAGIGGGTMDMQQHVQSMTTSSPMALAPQPTPQLQSSSYVQPLASQFATSQPTTAQTQQSQTQQPIAVPTPEVAFSSPSQIGIKPPKALTPQPPPVVIPASSSSSIVFGSASFGNPSASLGAVAQSSGVSPWHRNLAMQNLYANAQNSPFRATVGGAAAASSPFSGAHDVRTQPGVLQPQQPTVFGAQQQTQAMPLQPQPIMQPPQSQASPAKNPNLDLLDSIFNGPQVPVLSTAPTPVQIERSGHQQQAPPTATAAPSSLYTNGVPNRASASVHSATPQPIDNPPRPAAAVLPMQQQPPPPPQPIDQPVLTMMGATSVNYSPSLPSNIAPLPEKHLQTQVMNGGSSNQESTLSQSVVTARAADSFELGEGDPSKLARRQLHAAVRAGAPLPPLDPNDPLNALDSKYWLSK